MGCLGIVNLVIEWLLAAVGLRRALTGVGI